MEKNTLNSSLNIALEASAGTGKTFQLSMRVVGMLLNHVPPQDILCLTFTNKATDEMMERIIGTLSKIASGSGEKTQTDMLIDLMRQYGGGKKDDYDISKLQIDAKNAYEKLLEEFASLKVKTIDSFSSTILKLFPFEAQLRPDHTVCTEDENEELKKKAFYSIMEELLVQKEWADIFSNFAEIMEQNQSTVVDNLITYASFSCERRIELGLPLKRDPLPPHKIMETLIAAKNWRQTAIDKIKEFAALFESSTLTPSQKNIYDKLTVMENIRDAITAKIFYRDSPNLYSYFKKYQFSPYQLQLHAEIKESITKYLTHKGNVAKALSLYLGGALSEELRKVKNEKNKLTYTDISERVYDILVASKSVDNDYLYFRLDARISHILIDEFQDTSVTQWLTLKPLAEEAMAGVGQYDKSGSFFYVGDPKQNLYRFRGGNSALFQKATDLYSGKLFHETLDTNFRSGKNIVDAVNIIFKKAANIFNNDELKMFDINQKTATENGEGYISIELTENNNNDEDDESFTDFCVKKIRKALDAGFDYSDIAALVSVNKDGLQIKNALMLEDIPVRLETSGKLVDTGVFRAVIALAEFIETEDEFAFLEYALIAYHAFTTEKYSENQQREEIKANILKIAASKIGGTIFEKLLSVIINVDFQKRFEKEPDFIQTLDLIAAVAGDETDISEFKEKLMQNASDKTSTTAEVNKAVTVMTIHKSKGLQFPCVILPKLDFKMQTDAKNAPFILTENISGKASFEFVHTKKCAPFLNEKQSEALVNEDLLVTQDALNKLYVAMTRAEQALIINTKKTKNEDDEAKNIWQMLPILIDVPYEKGTLKPAKKSDTKNNEKLYLQADCYKLGEKINTQREIQGDYKNAAFGTALHMGAFLLSGFTEADIDKTFLQTIAVSGAPLSIDEKDELKNYLKLLATNHEWQKLFNGTVFRERKIGLKGELNSIDFYSIISNKIILIEYKTGEINDETMIKYENQLDKYAAILKKLYNLKVEKFIYHFHKNQLNILIY